MEPEFNEAELGMMNLVSDMFAAAKTCEDKRIADLLSRGATIITIILRAFRKTS